MVNKYYYNPLEQIRQLRDPSSITFERLPVTISALEVGTWVTVTTSGLKILSIEVYDDTNLERIFIEYRIITENTLEIKSNLAQTYTIHIIGFT